MIDPNELQRRGADVLRRYPYAVGGICAVTLILSFFNAWYLLVGLVALLAFGYFVSTGAGNASRVAAGTSVATTASRVDVNKLLGKYHDCMAQALARRANIERLIAETGDPGLRRALTESTRALPELTDTIYGLATKAQGVQGVLESSHSLDALTDEIERLETSIKGTTDEFQRGQYYATLDGKLQQMQNLTDTKVALERWDAQIENALSTLDTILSQVVRMQSSEVLSYTGATDDMSHSLREQVQELKATSDALDSVYGWRT
jgi:gas vesicle protein